MALGTVILQAVILIVLIGFAAAAAAAFGRQRRALEEAEKGRTAIAEERRASLESLGATLSEMQQRLIRSEPPAAAEPPHAADEAAAMDVRLAAMERSLREIGGVLHLLVEAAETSPPEPSVASADVAESPDQRLRNALEAAERALEANGSEGARANLNEMREAAQRSQALAQEIRSPEARTEGWRESFALDRLDRDAYRPVVPPVALSLIAEGEAEQLNQLAAEIVSYRRALQREIQERLAMQRIAVVPGFTRFDPANHRAAEDGWLRTEDQSSDQVIYEAVASGFTQGSEVLRKALVKRYLYSGAPDSAPAAVVEPAPAAAPEPPPSASRLAAVPPQPVKSDGDTGMER